MTRILIVDDEGLVRAGLRMILTTAAHLDVVAEAEDGLFAAQAVFEHQPDVVLMDIRMPRLDGLAATAQVLSLPRPPKVIALTTFDLDDYVFRALEVGACGFLLKDTPPQELIRAISVVADGEAMLAPTVTRRLISRFVDSGAGRQRLAQERLKGLTNREREVLTAVASGQSNADIGRTLFLSEATVKAHVSRLLTKLAATNRVQVAILAHEAGLTEP